MESIENIRHLILQYYQIHINDIIQIKGGWSALAHILTDNNNNRYLLKTYDKNRASTPTLTALVDSYMPVVDWLNTNTSLYGKIIIPIMTNEGKYKIENSGYIFLLSHYIEGNSLDEKELNNTEVYQLADIVAELHRYGDDIFPDTEKIKDRFDIGFCHTLKNTIINKKSINKELDGIFLEYSGGIIRATEHFISLAEKQTKRVLDYRLCHTDIHGGNLIQKKNGISLIDWENMKLSPVEADIFGLYDKPWFQIFLSKYKETHPNYQIDKINLQYYALKRNLEDIWEFTEQLQYDNLPKAAELQSIFYLKQECEKLKSHLTLFL